MKEVLTQAGINENRLKIASISADEGELYARVITEFKEQLEELGPIKPGEYEKQVIKQKTSKSSIKLDEL